MLRRLLATAVLILGFMSSTGCRNSLNSAMEEMDQVPNLHEVGTNNPPNPGNGFWRIKEELPPPPIRVHGGIEP
jgi:hypothetical protein